jgi:hypothetical protein
MLKCSMDERGITETITTHWRPDDPFHAPVCTNAEYLFLRYLFEVAVGNLAPDLSSQKFGGLWSPSVYRLKKSGDFGERSYMILTGKHAGFLGKHGDLYRPLFGKPYFSAVEHDAFTSYNEQIQEPVFQRGQYISALLLLLKRIGAHVDEEPFIQTTNAFTQLYGDMYLQRMRY